MKEEKLKKLREILEYHTGFGGNERELLDIYSELEKLLTSQ